MKNRALHSSLADATNPKEVQRALKDHSCLTQSEAKHVISTLLRISREHHRQQNKGFWNGLKDRIKLNSEPCT